MFHKANDELKCWSEILQFKNRFDQLLCDIQNDYEVVNTTNVGDFKICAEKLASYIVLFKAFLNTFRTDIGIDKGRSGIQSLVEVCTEEYEDLVQNKILALVSPSPSKMRIFSFEKAVVDAPNQLKCDLLREMRSFIKVSFTEQFMEKFFKTGLPEFMTYTTEKNYPLWEHFRVFK